MGFFSWKFLAHISVNAGHSVGKEQFSKRRKSKTGCWVWSDLDIYKAFNYQLRQTSQQVISSDWRFHALVNSQCPLIAWSNPEKICLLQATWESVKNSQWFIFQQKNRWTTRSRTLMQKATSINIKHIAASFVPLQWLPWDLSRHLSLFLWQFKRNVYSIASLFYAAVTDLRFAPFAFSGKTRTCEKSDKYLTLTQWYLL